MESVLEASQQQRQRQNHPSTPPSLLPSALPADKTPPHPRTSSPRATSSSPPPTPQFSPFFTLITSTSTPTSAAPSTTHHHPHTHYIFSSDDSDAITPAALSTLEPHRAHNAHTSAGPGERYLLLDLDPTGTLITRAQSMSPDFQLLSTSITAAPTWETGDEEGGGAAGSGDKQVGRGGGLMLKIVGTEGIGRGGGRGLEAVVEEYAARMGELRRVIEGGGGGRYS